MVSKVAPLAVESIYIGHRQQAIIFCDLMGLPAILDLARNMIASAIREGCAAIDGTVGRGKDTVFLAQCVGRNGIVFGFDVQEVALDSTRALVDSYDLADRVRLFHAGHELICETIRPILDRPLRAAMFNLGYLPDSDRSVITRPDTSIRALEGVLSLLDVGGTLTAALYTGHRGGLEEEALITSWCSALPADRFRVVRYEVLNRSAAPSLVAVQRI